MGAQRRLTIEVSTQCILYTICYFMIATLNLVLRSLGNGKKPTREDEPKYFILIALVSFFYPLHGFLNFLVYIRPRIAVCRNLSMPFSRRTTETVSEEFAVEIDV